MEQSRWAEPSPVNYPKRNIKCGNSDIMGAKPASVGGGNKQEGETRRDGFAASRDP